MAETDKRTALLTGHTNQEELVSSPGIWTVAIANATGGTLDIDVNGDTLTFNYDDTAQEWHDAIVASLDTDSDDVTVTGSGTTVAPFRITIFDAEGSDLPVVDNLDDSSLTGTGAAATLTTVQEPAVQAHHLSTVVTDPESEDAVITPFEQQTGGLAAQAEPSPSDTLG